jgi:hypothetical protein
MSLRHFIYQTLKYSSSNHLPIKSGNEVKFGTGKKGNMYLPRIWVKFSDRYKTLGDTTKKQIIPAECSCIL